MDTIVEYITLMFKYFIIAIPIFSLIRFVWGRLKAGLLNWGHETRFGLVFSFLTGIFRSNIPTKKP